MSAGYQTTKILALYHITLSDPSSDIFTRMSARTSELGGALLMNMSDTNRETLYDTPLNSEPRS